jgi:hypothetical protein
VLLYPRISAQRFASELNSSAALSGWKRLKKDDLESSTLYIVDIQLVGASTR